jgi:hypothetical protein
MILLWVFVITGILVGMKTGYDWWIKKCIKDGK